MRIANSNETKRRPPFASRGLVEDGGACRVERPGNTRAFSLSSHPEDTAPRAHYGIDITPSTFLHVKMK